MWLRDGVETMSLDGTAAGSLIPGLPDDRQRDVVYLHVFPNLLVSLHPDYVMTHRMRGRWRRTAPWWSASGSSPPRLASARASTRRTPPTSGTSPTGRTGRPARASSAAWPRRGLPSRDRLSTSYEYVVKSFVDMTARGYLTGGLPVPEPVAETLVRSR